MRTAVFASTQRIQPFTNAESQNTDGGVVFRWRNRSQTEWQGNSPQTNEGDVMMQNGEASAGYADFAGHTVFNEYPPLVVRSSSIVISRLSLTISENPASYSASAFPSGCRGAPRPSSG